MEETPGSRISTNPNCLLWGGYKIKGQNINVFEVYLIGLFQNNYILYVQLKTEK